MYVSCGAGYAFTMSLIRTTLEQPSAAETVLHKFVNDADDSSSGHTGTLSSEYLIVRIPTHPTAQHRCLISWSAL
jgi:hypothetical protein